MRKFKGNIEQLIYLHGFVKDEESEDVESIYEVFELELFQDLKIEIIINHHPEEEDDINFKLIRGESSIPLKIYSKSDLNFFMKIIV